MARGPIMPECSARGLRLLWGCPGRCLALLGERQEGCDGLSQGRGRCGAGPGGCQARGYPDGLDPVPTHSTGPMGDLEWVPPPLCASVSPPEPWCAVGLAVRAGRAPGGRGSAWAWRTGAPWKLVPVPFPFHQPAPGSGPLSPPTWRALWDQVSRRRRAETARAPGHTPENPLAGMFA